MQRRYPRGPAVPRRSATRRRPRQSAAWLHCSTGTSTLVPTLRCRRWRIGCTFCQRRGKASWAPMAIRIRVSSCRRCRCQDECGPVVVFSSTLPLRIGTQISRLSRIAAVNVKQGRSGALVFVKVAHEVRCEGALAVSEEQDIVYRDAPQPDTEATPIPAPQGAAWTRQIQADPALSVPLLGPDIQRAPHPLRPAVCDAGGTLSRSRRAWPADRDAAARPGAALRAECAPCSFFSFRALMPLFDANAIQYLRSTGPEGFKVHSSVGAG